MGENYNQRIMLTKRLLKESLLEILRKKDIRRVSVTELCRKAGINRSTFYAHYGIPEDVLAEIKSEFAVRISDALAGLDAGSPPKQILVCICRSIYDNREVEKVILSNSDDEEVLEAALGSSYRIWESTGAFKKGRLIDPDAQRLTGVFCSHGMFRVIREWVLYDIPKSPEEVAGILYEILYAPL